MHSLFMMSDGETVLGLLQSYHKITLNLKLLTVYFASLFLKTSEVMQIHALKLYLSCPCYKVFIADSFLLLLALLKRRYLICLKKQWMKYILFKFMSNSFPSLLLPFSERPSSAGLVASSVSIVSVGWCGTSSLPAPTTWDDGLGEWWCRTPSLNTQKRTY